MCIVVVYVDDIISQAIMCLITSLKAHLHSVFNIKDLGDFSFFLGIEVSILPTRMI